MLRKGLVIGIIVLFFGMSIVPSIGSTDIDKFTTPIFDGNILYVGGSGPENYTKIWYAINDAVDGDTVFVYDDSSPYHEHVTVDKEIDLIGENKETTVIDGDGIMDVVYISADGVSISGFTLQNSGEYSQDAGIDIGANNAIVSYNIILDCGNGINMDDFRFNNEIIGNTISSTRLKGIRLWDSSYNNLILNNTIYSNQGDGIQLYHCNNNDILGNEIYSNNVGMYIVSSENNTLSENIISSNKYYGMHIYISTNNIISYNSFFNDGLSFSVSYKNTVSSNTVNDKPIVYLENENNIIFEADAGQIILVKCDNIIIRNQEISHTSDAIQLLGTDNSLIYDNVLLYNNRGIDLHVASADNSIEGNIISNNDYGIYSNCYRTNIEGNTISNNGHGIHSTLGWGNTILSNIISNNSYGVKIRWGSHNNISFNNFLNNDRDAIFNVFFVERLNNWSSNYWGRSRVFPKPIFGKLSFSNSKFYIPWLTFDWNPAKEPYDI